MSVFYTAKSYLYTAECNLHKGPQKGSYFFCLLLCFFFFLSLVFGMWKTSLVFCVPPSLPSLFAYSNKHEEATKTTKPVAKTTKTCQIYVCTCFL